MRLLTGRIAACFLALAVGSTLTVGAAAATSRDTSDPSAAALLRQVQAMVTPPATAPMTLARTASGSAPATVRPHDGTPAMVALRTALPKLSAADRARALALLGVSASAPCPDANGVGDTQNTYQTMPDLGGHFEIHFTTTGPNASDPVYVSRVATTLDTVYDTEITSMGYQPPLTPALSTSGWWSGGAQIPIELCNISPEYYGFCAAVGGSATWSFPAACTLRNSYANQTVGNLTYAYYNPRLDGTDTDAPLKVTAAHEFFHAVQFRQDAEQPLWLMEGSAVWMENEVYPKINDYLQYLPFTGIKQPLVPFNTKSTYTPYGDFALFKTLSGVLGRDSVRQVWTYLGQHLTPSYNPNALTALQAVASAHHRSLTSLLLTYAVWNTLAPHGYPSMNLYQPAVWWLNPRLDRSNRFLTARRILVRPMADAPVAIVRGPRVLSTTRLQIVVSGPSGATGGWLTLRRQLTNGTSYVTNYPIGARGTILTITFNAAVSYVAITLNNTATSGVARYFGIRATVL